MTPRQDPTMLRFFVLPALLVFSSTARAQWTTDGGATLDVPAGGEPVAGLGLDALPALAESLLDEAVAADGPGVGMVVLYRGELVYSGARGLADLEHSVPCSSGTVFDMASVSKSVTAAAIATLVEEGRVDPEVSVREYLPDLDDVYEPVLVRDLIHHTGGVEDVTGILALAGIAARDGGSQEDALRILTRLQHLRFEPGTAHMYSNGGYLLLTEIVRVVSGQTLPEFAHERFFEPLGMSSARLVSRAGELFPARAVGVHLEAGQWLRATVSVRHGAGGLFCSLPDLARWAEAIRTGKVLGSKVRDRMRTRGTLEDGTTLDYAYGIGLTRTGSREGWTHSGSVPGGQSFLSFYPEEELVVVAASCTLENPNIGKLATDLVDLALGKPVEVASQNSGAIFITSEQVAPPESEGVEVEPEVLASYAGSYDVEGMGLVLTVASRGEELLIGFGDEPAFRIHPLPDGSFVLPSAGFGFRFDPEQDRVHMEVPREGESQTNIGRRRVPEVLAGKSLEEVLGTYRSAELGAFYRIRQVRGQLVLEHPRHGRLPMRLLAEDRYTLPGHDLARIELVREGGVLKGFELEAYSWGARSFFERTNL